MQILPPIGEQFAGQEGGPTAGAGRNAAGRWRHELERAQLTLRGGLAAAAAPMPPGPPQATGSRSAPHAAQISSATDRARARTALPGTGGGRGADLDTTFAHAPRAAHSNTGQDRRGSPAYEGRSANAARSGGDAPETNVAPRQRPAALSAWPQSNVHAIRSEDTLDVWVRDSSLGDSARRRLAAQLRAGIATTGLRLGALVVNGETILPPAAAASDPDRAPSDQTDK